LPSFYLIMFIFFSVLFAWAFVEPQFMFYAYDDLAWTSSQVGLVMSVFGLACLFSELALGRLSDRFGRKPVLILGLALFAVAFIGLVIFRSPTWLLVCFFLGGLGDGLFDPALSAHILDITPSEQTARIMGLKSTAGSIGNMLGPALVVLITRFVGPQIVFLIAAALVITITIAAAPALQAPQRKAISSNYSNAAVTR
jgi:MFS family permease